MRKTWVLAGAAVLAAVTAAGSVAVTTGPKLANAITPQPTTPHTARVEQRTLSAMISEPGTLTYRAQADGSPYAVINKARGAYTELPVPGQVISQGHALYRVNNSPVVLLYGSTPAYRTLSAGATGPDVAELNKDLVALGYATSAGLSRSSADFGPATSTALGKLQAALGVTQNGTLRLGQAVFEPSAVRVTTVSAPPGGSAQRGQTVLRGTSTARQVQVALDAAQQTNVGVGDKVRITLPNNRTTPGTVTSVGAVATCPPSSASAGPGSSTAAPGTDTCTSASSSTPTITVGVTPSDPTATGTWDQAPVQVSITTASARNALVVPVTALLARSGGGYAVELARAGAGDHLVPVSLGLFDDAEGLVQVTGSGLVAGQEVVVASA